MPRKSVVLLIETSSQYCRGLLDGIIAFMKERGNWSVHLDQQRGASPPAWLKSWDGDGIIARIDTDDYGEQLKNFGVPIVDLSAARRVAGIPWAETDDQAISRLAFDHFYERRFKNVGYCGAPEFNWSVRRAQHFRRLATKAGCEFFEYQSTPSFDESFHPGTEMKRLVQWIDELPRPVAIMVCYDSKALQVLEACNHLKIAVPEQVAVLGVDNDRLFCELSKPPLSSIVPDTQQTGYDAAAMLDRMMAGERVETAKPLLTQPLGIEMRASTDTVAIEDEQIAKALQYIRRHATANIRVADILGAVSLSRRTLEKRFKHWLGHTPHEEIQRVRMNRIKELLSETELSVHEIAERAGFEHNEYMAAAFKRETGMTPTMYREQVRKS